jgi:hypothetical protein
MKILITLNFAIGVLLTISMVVFEKYELIGLLSGIFLLPSFLVLALINFGAIFLLWRKKHLRAFVPIGTYVIAAALFLLGTNLGTKLILNGTPCDPNSFFNEQTKSELTQVAKQLVAEHQRKDFSPGIGVVAQKHNLKPIFVDDQQKIVVFGFYHRRHWFEYIWAKNGLTEPYSMPATITMADIEDWKEFKRIAKQGDTATLAERHRMEFEPSIVYPLLRDSLGAAFLDRFRNAPSGKDDFTDEDENAILAALNKQHLASSALVENSQITYEEWHWHWQKEIGLHIAKDYISDSFWVGQLLKQLLSEGVLTLAPDGRHLKIKADLTDRQRLQIEWLHVGIMNFAYGNLLEKRIYVFRKNLGSNWYFNDW